MTDAVTFTVPGQPVPFAWRQRGRARYVPPRQKSAMHAIGLCARRAMAGRPPLEGPLELSASFHRCRPKRKGEARAPLPDTRKPDVTNLVKLLEDALTGIVFADDAQVVRISASKWASADAAYASKTIVTVKRAAA